MFFPLICLGLIAWLMAIANTNATKVVPKGPLQFLARIDGTERARFNSLMNNQNLTKAEVEKELQEWAKRNNVLENYQQNVSAKIEQKLAQLVQAGQSNLAGPAKEAFQQIVDLNSDDSLTRRQLCQRIRSVLNATEKMARHFLPLQLALAFCKSPLQLLTLQPHQLIAAAKPAACKPTVPNTTAKVSVARDDNEEEEEADETKELAIKDKENDGDDDGDDEGKGDLMRTMMAHDEKEPIAAETDAKKESEASKEA